MRLALFALLLTPFAAAATPVSATSVDELVALAPDLRREVAEEALEAVSCAQKDGTVKLAERMAIIDYSLPSRVPRMWVFDLTSGELTFHEYVAHGQGSGQDIPDRFSNREGSHQSSLGLFTTANTYVGANGYSLRLDGQSGALNSSARERQIVMHGAPYVDSDAAQSMGRLGRSWGCPAVRPEVAQALIDSLKDGQLIYAYGPGSSAAVQCDIPHPQAAAGTEREPASRKNKPTIKPADVKSGT